MKKTVTMVACLMAIVMTFSGCLSSMGLSQEDQQELKEILDSVSEPVGGKSVDDTSPSDYGDEYGDFEAIGDILPFKVEDQVIIDEQGLKVTTKGIEMDDPWIELKLLIENNTNKSLTFYTGYDDSYINDYAVNMGLAEEVAAGKKANGSILIDVEDLEMAGITNVETLEFSIHTQEQDTASYEYDFWSDPIKLTTDRKANETKFEGNTLYDKDGIKIIVGDMYSGWDDSPTVNFYIENNTDETVSLLCEDCSINGFMIDAALGTVVGPYKKAVDNIMFLDDELEEIEVSTVDDVEELQFTLEVKQEDTYNTIAITEPYTITK